MKLHSSILLSFSILQPSLALVGLSWDVSGIPDSGLSQITFPMNMANAPHKSGFFFAQQFSFQGKSDVGYVGLQPRPDSKSKPVIHAVFSSFIAGTTTVDSNCHKDADGGPGVSCAVEFSSSYADTYELHINNTKGTTWTGTVINSVTGLKTHIGSYTLPAGTSGIKGSQIGFVEYYPWNSGSHHCSTLPRTSVTFGIPTSSGHSGSLKQPYEYGDCVGQVKFDTHKTTDGYEVSVGF